MLLGYPIGEIVWLALWIAGAGILVGILAGLFGIGGGAIIVPVLYEVFRVLDVPEDVRMQLCIGTSLAIIIPTTVRSYLAHKKKGAVIPQVVRLWALPAIVGVAIGSVIACLRAGAGVQDRLRHVRGYSSARKMLFGTRPLEPRDANCRDARPLTVLRLHHRAVFLAGRRQRRRDVERGAHALRPADAAGGGDLRRHRRADHHCRHHRLHAGGLAAHGATAAAVDRLRLADRLCADGAGVELYDELWRAARALAAAAQARNRLRHVF